MARRKTRKRCVCGLGDKERPAGQHYTLMQGALEDAPDYRKRGDWWWYSKLLKSAAEQAAHLDWHARQGDKIPWKGLGTTLGPTREGKRKLQWSSRGRYAPERHEAAIREAQDLLNRGVTVELNDGSGWAVRFYPDGSFCTSNGCSPSGAERYLDSGAGLVGDREWRLDVWKEPSTHRSTRSSGTRGLRRRSW